MDFSVSVNAVTDVALLEQDRILSLFLIVLGPLCLDVLLVVWVEHVGVTAIVFLLFYACRRPSLCCFLSLSCCLISRAWRLGLTYVASFS